MGENLKKALKECSKEQILSILYKFIDRKEIAEEVISTIRNNQINEVAEKDIDYDEFKSLWEEAEEKISFSSEYGGCEEEDEFLVDENLEKIVQIFKKGNLDDNIKRDFMEDCIEFYHDGNSGFDDILIESVSEICSKKEDWLYFIELLKRNDENSYTKDIIMDIYKNELKDEASYLGLRKSNLEYGLDYFDLVEFYMENNNKSKALETALEGIEKGHGRIIELIDFVADYYKNDYEERLKFLCMGFMESPSLKRYKNIKKYCSKKDWPAVSKKLYSSLNDNYVKADIDYYNEEYGLVLKYLDKRPLNFDSWAKKLEKHYPEEIIERYKTRADGIIKQKIAKKYPEAVDYCNKIKLIYLKRLQSPEKWEEYLEELRKRHSKLPALQKLLEKL